MQAGVGVGCLTPRGRQKKGQDNECFHMTSGKRSNECEISATLADPGLLYCGSLGGMSAEVNIMAPHADNNGAMKS